MTETFALLLTDVVDSTRLVERLGDAAAAELGSAHDRVARDLLRAWGGREIDKTDGMLMLFERAADAVGYALAYHRALAALAVPLQARAGLHVGPLILRPNPPQDVAHGAKPLEVEGLSKPLAARVMSLALGGQTLLTREARDALGDAPRWRVQPHGHWRVKGLADPVELFEVGDDGAPFTPPPDSAKVYRVVRDGELWLPRREVRHSLPAERDAFVGRREALAALARRFDEGARLVSVLGIGGTGKPRLAVRFGWTWLGDYPGGVWFCDLAAARDLDGVVNAVARGLHVELRGDVGAAQLGHAIAARGTCLVILDNFEQVARLAGETLGRWLDGSGPAARFLVTTREVLGLPGEEAVALPPLSVAEAQVLFERRATAARPDYAVEAGDREAIPALVGLLDGLPLAIELAAARVRLLSPQALLARMDRRLTLLAAQGGRHDRQATLRATFDWSWDLLAAPERSALAQLAVFEGGFSLDAAEAVIDLSDFDLRPATLDVLQSLVDKSLVQRTGTMRCGLLVSVQDYAREKLHDAPGDACAEAERRHAAYFGRFSGDDAAARDEIENCLAALRRVEARGLVDAAVVLLERAWLGLQQRGPFRIAAERAERLLRLALPDEDLRARTHWVAGDAWQLCGRGAQAYDHLEAAARLAERGGDALSRGRALRKLGNLDLTRGHAARALERLQAALGIAEAAGDARLAIDAETSLGNLAEARGRPDAARTHYETAIARAAAIGDQRREGAAHGNLAVLHAENGEMAQALEQHRLALTAADATDNRSLQANTLVNIGMLQQLMGDDAGARLSLERALKVARDSGSAVAEAVALCNLGIVFESSGRAHDARSQYEAAIGLAQVLADRCLQGQFLGYLGRLHARQQRPVEAARCLDAGQALLEQAIDRIGLGILMCSRAEASHLAGDGAAARSAFATAESIANEVGAGRDSELGMALARLRGPIRAD